MKRKNLSKPVSRYCPACRAQRTIGAYQVDPAHGHPLVYQCRNCAALLEHGPRGMRVVGSAPVVLPGGLLGTRNRKEPGP